MKIEKPINILNDSTVLEWFEDNKQGRLSTAETWLRTLQRVCTNLNKQPKEIRLMKKKELDDLIRGYIKLRQNSAPQTKRSFNRSIQGSTIANEIKILKSYLSSCGVKVNELKKFKIKDANETNVSTTESIPSQSQLRQVLNAAKPRERAIISLLAFSGMRPEVLGSYKGETGLRLRDIPSLKISQSKVEILDDPAMIVIPGALSKIRSGYVTFIGPEGIANLTAYLQSRQNMGEKLEPASPVISALNGNKFLYTTKLSDLARKVMRNSSLPHRVYVWRSYFATRASLAEKTGLPRATLQFFMGHKTGTIDKYTTQKVLGEDTINEMKEGYKAALPYLETTIDRKSMSDVYNDFVREMAVHVFDMDEEDLSRMTSEEIFAVVRGEMKKLTEDDSVLEPATPKKTLAVKPEDLNDYLSKNWKFIGPAGPLVVVQEP